MILIIKKKKKWYDTTTPYMYEVAIKGGFPWTHYDKLHIHGKKKNKKNKQKQFSTHLLDFIILESQPTRFRQYLVRLN